MELAGYLTNLDWNTKYFTFSTSNFVTICFNLRSTACGFYLTVAYVGMMCAPWIAVWLTNFHKNLPFYTLGGMDVLASLAAINLEETCGQQLDLNDSGKTRSKETTDEEVFQKELQDKDFSIDNPAYINCDWPKCDGAHLIYFASWLTGTSWALLKHKHKVEYFIKQTTKISRLWKPTQYVLFVLLGHLLWDRYFSSTKNIKGTVPRS